VIISIGAPPSPGSQSTQAYRCRLSFAGFKSGVERLKMELFCGLKHRMKVSSRSKWWPLPSHARQPSRTSKFSFPKIASTTMLYCSVDREPTSETVWLKPWQVALSERIASRGKWASIVAKLS